MSVKLLYEAYHYNDHSSTLTINSGFLEQDCTIYFTFELDAHFTIFLNFSFTILLFLQPQWNFKTCIFLCLFFNKMLRYFLQEPHNSNVQTSARHCNLSTCLYCWLFYLLVGECPVNNSIFELEVQQQKYFCPVDVQIKKISLIL